MALGGFYAAGCKSPDFLRQWGTNRGENPSKAEIEIQFGSLLFKLTGPAQYLGKNLLAFDFTHMKLMLFGRAVYSGFVVGNTATFYRQPIAKLPSLRSSW